MVRALPGGVSRSAARGLLLLVFTALFVDGFRGHGVKHTDTLDDQRSLAAEVRGWLDAGESVYAVNCAHLLALARAEKEAATVN